MNDKITKSPQIRFAGFTDAWEQVKLKDCFTERSERSAEGELISVTINSGVVKASDLDRKDNSSSDKSNYKVVKVGDIAYNSMRMWQGASGFSPYDGILSPAYTVITPKENSNPKFFAYNFKRHEMIWTFQINSQGLTSDTWNLKFPALSSIKIAVPSYKEQTEIASFFEKLDHQLALHQRELELLKNTKKSLIQKMFPRDGANVPEIRFSGFTDAWEQRKFEFMFDSISNNTLSRASLNYDEGTIMNIHYGDILVKYGAVTDCSKEVIPFITGAEALDYQNKHLRNGDILFADAAEDMTVGKATEITGITDVPVVSGLHTIACRPKVKIKSKYLGYYINSPSYRQQLYPLMQGIKVLSVSRKNLAGTIIYYPASAEEQSQIGEFFSQLDNLITLHQRELDLLKSLKKSLLHQMFI
ncbi:restriction endonuclease subunit S [Bacillus cereus]|nr:restriction endonuclease subunit S [Bacillus cereus]